MHANTPPRLLRLASPCHTILTSTGIRDYWDGTMLLLAFLPWHSTWLGVREHTHA